MFPPLSSSCPGSASMANPFAKEFFYLARSLSTSLLCNPRRRMRLLPTGARWSPWFYSHWKNVRKREKEWKKKEEIIENALAKTCLLHHLNCISPLSSSEPTFFPYGGRTREKNRVKTGRRTSIFLPTLSSTSQQTLSKALNFSLEFQFQPLKPEMRELRMTVRLSR